MRNRAKSHLAWGAWIEIRALFTFGLQLMSHLAWGAWIEMQNYVTICEIGQPSHLAWGAWIEIPELKPCEWITRVAPRMGCVD